MNVFLWIFLYGIFNTSSRYCTLAMPSPLLEKLTSVDVRRSKGTLASIIHDAFANIKTATATATYGKVSKLEKILSSLHRLQDSYNHCAFFQTIVPFVPHCARFPAKQHIYLKRSKPSLRNSLNLREKTHAHRLVSLPTVASVINSDSIRDKLPTNDCTPTRDSSVSVVCRARSSISLPTSSSCKTSVSPTSIRCQKQNSSPQPPSSNLRSTFTHHSTKSTLMTTQTSTMPFLDIAIAATPLPSPLAITRLFSRTNVISSTETTHAENTVRKSNHDYNQCITVQPAINVRNTNNDDEATTNMNAQRQQRSEIVVIDVQPAIEIASFTEIMELASEHTAIASSTSPK